MDATAAARLAAPLEAALRRVQQRVGTDVDTYYASAFRGYVHASYNNYPALRESLQHRVEAALAALARNNKADRFQLNSMPSVKRGVATLALRSVLKTNKDHYAALLGCPDAHHQMDLLLEDAAVRLPLSADLTRFAMHGKSPPARPPARPAPSHATR
jgi:hypothetical protein